METALKIETMGPLLVVGMSDNSLRVFTYTPRDPQKLIESNQHGALYTIPGDIECTESSQKIIGLDGHLLI